MYDELVKRLRAAAIMSDALSVFLPHSEGSAVAKLYNEAAEAIEKLATNYDAATDIMRHQTEYIEELEASKPRWIPVTELLPEKGQKVLIYWEEAGEPVIDTAFWQGEWAATHWANMGEKVTHWMPLPEPPKEE